MSADKTGEVIVAEVDTLAQANAIRSELLANHARLWLIVSRNQVTLKFEVFAANEWCGRLSDEKLDELRETCSRVASSFECVIELTDEDFIEEHATQSMPAAL